ncbi:MAG: cyclic nucleotide-binding domain-containing protein [Proteobacteria bacterium]|nr:cyclic nucleotide-binding domain-containing protein [Pseudomonadota bacterium]
MSDPKANYLKFTAPESEFEFVELLGEIPRFSKVPDELLHRIFNYSKFILLTDGERPINQGMYDQEIFILLKGKLEVYVKTSTGDNKIDIIENPFSLFGERCILGEARGASIEADGDVLLLGIDLSALPDILDALEFPENKLDDEQYRDNKGMYTLFATVLLERLDRLIKDQYKLNQKLIRVHASQDLKVSWWKQEVLLTRIFNEFCDNQISAELDIKSCLIPVFEQYNIRSKRLNGLLKPAAVDTSQVYFELVRLHALGEFEDLNKIVYILTRQLTVEAYNSRRYVEMLHTEPINFPQLVPLSNYLDTFHREICEANVLKKELLKRTFLDACLAGNKLNPSLLISFLEDGEWINSQFDLAHVMYLACQQCIIQVSEVNHAITEYLKLLMEKTKPKKLSSDSTIEFSSIQEGFQQVYDKSMPEENKKSSKKSIKGSATPVEPSKESKDANSPDHNIDDILSKFGM